MAINTYAKGSPANLSNNFAAYEFSCHGNGCCSTTQVDTKLVEYLQKIRDHFKQPVTITSGYRCPTHNRNVGGATGSYHAKGQAADIVVRNVAPAEVAKFAESIGILGIGLYETNYDGYFVHVDTRDYKSFWYGQGQAYRETFGGAKPKETYTLKEFVKDVQKACGAAVDGIAGPETLSKTVTISAAKNATHAVVKCVQKRLFVLGYTEVGTADGIAGAKFTAAVTHFQKDNNCWADGEITRRNMTWKKLLGLA